MRNKEKILPSIQQECVTYVNHKLESSPNYNALDSIEDIVQITAQLIYNGELFLDDNGDLEYIDG
ncbi:MAG: hypothetical protein CMH22_06215 [Methylophaga sp.]|nr:hypothetical protein [Methylophaga sp.]|tara:strand:+ start:39959 stop:40153 length:195 start_codon:yes stop_codon:yes gene_type:complete